MSVGRDTGYSVVTDMPAERQQAAAALDDGVVAMAVMAVFAVNVSFGRLVIGLG